jgi:hypothetical protein
MGSGTSMPYSVATFKILLTWLVVQDERPHPTVHRLTYLPEELSTRGPYNVPLVRIS